MTNLSFICEIKGPWIVTTRDAMNKLEIPDGFLLLESDGRQMGNLEGLYKEMSVTFKFPSYFGNNFNALGECLTDLDWPPAEGYIMVIKHAESSYK